MPFPSTGSSQPRDRTPVSCTAAIFFYQLRCSSSEYLVSRNSPTCLDTGTTVSIHSVSHILVLSNVCKDPPNPKQNSHWHSKQRSVKRGSQARKGTGRSGCWGAGRQHPLPAEPSAQTRSSSLTLTTKVKTLCLRTALGDCE